MNSIKKRKSISSQQTYTNRSSRYKQFSQNPYSRRESEYTSYPDSRQSLSNGIVDTNQFSMQACYGDVGNLLVIDPRAYELEPLFATCSSQMNEQTIKFWDYDKMMVRFEVPKKGFGSIISMVYCPISKQFATITYDRKLSLYVYDPQENCMNHKFCLRLNIPPSHVQIHKNYLFVSSNKKKQIQWISLKTKKIIKTFPFTEDLTKFCFVPKLNALATNKEGCSLIKLFDGSTKHIYYQVHERNKSPLSKHHLQSHSSRLQSSEVLRSNIMMHSSCSLDSPSKGEQQKQIIKTVAPTLVKNGIGINGENQICQIAMYEQSLNCIIFAFFDFILFYDILQKKIIYVIKDLMPIENIQYSYLHDLLIVQCAENSSTDSSFYLCFQKEDSLNSTENISPLLFSDLKFNKLSCQLLQRARNFYFLEQYLIMDSIQQEMRGCVIRRRIMVNRNFNLPSLKGSSYPSRKVSRSVYTYSNKKQSQFSPFPSEFINNQDGGNKLEIVEEEAVNTTTFVEKQQKNLQLLYLLKFTQLKAIIKQGKVFQQTNKQINKQINQSTYQQTKKQIK